MDTTHLTSLGCRSYYMYTVQFQNTYFIWDKLNQIIFNSIHGSSF